MQLNVKYLVLVCVCVSGYKITNEPNQLNDDNYSLLVTNQSNDISLNQLPSSEAYQGKSSISEDDVRSEALIKKIHPFVYPKQFNVIDNGQPNRGFNSTNEHNLMEIRDVDDAINNDRLDEMLTPPDHKPDLIPLGTHFFERPAKHGHFHYGLFDRPHQTHAQLQPQTGIANNCLLGLLHGCDPLVLLGILGFLAYVINTVLGLVNRINLPLLAPVTAAEMTAAAVSNAAAAAAAGKTSFIQRQNLDERTIESNQKLLKDFERILQMAIEVYEQKFNTN